MPRIATHPARHQSHHPPKLVMRQLVASVRSLPQIHLLECLSQILGPGGARWRLKICSFGMSYPSQGLTSWELMVIIFSIPQNKTSANAPPAEASRVLPAPAEASSASALQKRLPPRSAARARQPRGVRDTVGRERPVFSAGGGATQQGTRSCSKTLTISWLRHFSRFDSKNVTEKQPCTLFSLQLTVQTPAGLTEQAKIATSAVGKWTERPANQKKTRQLGAF